MIRVILSPLFRLYALTISPFFGPCCRYVPTCSAYAQEALARHGPVKGGLLAVARLLSCHPLSRRPRLDPVPERFAWREILGYKKPRHCPRDHNTEKT